MSPATSALWGLAGALVVEALELAAEIRRNKGRWPWGGRTVVPSFVAVVLRLGASALLTAAMADQFAGRWPAFCIGVAAPVVIARVAESVPTVRGVGGEGG